MSDYEDVLGEGAQSVMAEIQQSLRTPQGCVQLLQLSEESLNSGGNAELAKYVISQAAARLLYTREGRELALHTFGEGHPVHTTASNLIDQDFEQEASRDHLLRDKEFMMFERAHQQGHREAGQWIAEHAWKYGAPTPTRRQLVVLSPEDRQRRVAQWQAQAENRGLTFQQHLRALDEAGAKAISTELAPTLLYEERATADLKQLGRERIDGRSHGESLGAYVRHEAEGKGAGAREKPFDPKLTPEQRRDEYLKTVPRETLAGLRQQGVESETVCRQGVPGGAHRDGA